MRERRGNPSDSKQLPFVKQLEFLILLLPLRGKIGRLWGNPSFIPNKVPLCSHCYCKSVVPLVTNIQTILWGNLIWHSDTLEGMKRGSAGKAPLHCYSKDSRSTFIHFILWDWDRRYIWRRKAHSWQRAWWWCLETSMKIYLYNQLE